MTIRTALLALVLIAAACGNDERVPDDDRGERPGDDRDGDGGLDDAGVDAPEGTGDAALWRGDFTIDHGKDPAAVAALRRARAVTGSLTLVDGIALPRLEVVGGNLNMGSSATVSLPSLWLIGGTLWITGSPDDLHLPALTTIAGNLEAWSQGTLGALRLPALTHVDGAVRFPGPVRTVELPRLATVGGNLEVRCQALQTLALEALRWIGGDVRIERAPALTRLSLPALGRVVGRFGIGVEIGTGDVPLVSIDAPVLEQVGSLAIMRAPRLAALDLSRLARTAGDVTLSELPALRRFTAPLVTMDTEKTAGRLTVQRTGIEELTLPLVAARAAVVVVENRSLRAVRLPAARTLGHLEVTHNEALEAIEVTALSAIDALVVSGSPALTTLDLHSVVSAARIDLMASGIADLSGLRGVRSVGTIMLGGLPHLTSLEGLAVTRIATMYIGSNQALQSLRGLDALTEITLLELHDNDALTDLSALSAVAHFGSSYDFGPEGMISIGNHAQLTSLRGLEGVRQLRGRLSLRDNDRLADLGALSGLTVVGALTLVGNPALTSLAGLEQLEVVTRDAIINRNEGLASLDGLRGLRAVTGSLQVERNHSLPTDEADAFRARLGK